MSGELNIISPSKEDICLIYTVDCLINDENKSDIIQLIKKLDLGIDDVQVEQEDSIVDALPKNLPDNMKKIARYLEKTDAAFIDTIHHKFDKDGNYQSKEKFNLKTNESKGTQKLFALSGLLLNTLKEGDILIIDELDSSLYLFITTAIVELFNSKEGNPNNAQLIFMTHDTNLLSNKMFRRDQIWFTEKNRYSATDLYSLAEYKIRNDASFENDYIKGRYGAIPYIGDLTHLADSHV
ncbi:MAG: AAA family ATPase [Rivularia sp. (in: cyanobacteria)]